MPQASFRFRLERVRALRERSEDAAKEALAGAMLDHHRCEQALHTAADRIAGARKAQLDAVSRPARSTDLMARQAYLERTELAHVARGYDLARQAEELARTRELLTVAARERQALERLKDRRRGDHEREMARREGIVLDEIAINGYRRRSA
jgi:flagellar FliJ protein